MYGFTHADVVEETSLYKLWRRADVACIRVTGIVDDDKSEVWRAGLLAHIERSGYPRFAALDSAASDPHNSLRSRLGTAAFARSLARRIEWGAVLTGPGPGPLVVVRTVMRVVGMPNIYLFQSPAEFGQALASCLAGRRPLKWADTAVEGA